jgi:hypothetical protein
MRLFKTDFLKKICNTFYHHMGGFESTLFQTEIQIGVIRQQSIAAQCFRFLFFLFIIDFTTKLVGNPSDRTGCNVMHFFLF